MAGWKGKHHLHVLNDFCFNLKSSNVCFAWREGKCFCWQNLTALRLWCGWEMLFPQNDFSNGPRGQRSARRLVVRFSQLSVRHTRGVNRIHDCTSRPPALKYLHFPQLPWGNDACAPLLWRNLSVPFAVQITPTVFWKWTNALMLSACTYNKHAPLDVTPSHAWGVYMFVQSQNLMNICPGHISLQHQKETKINKERKVLWTLHLWKFKGYFDIFPKVLQERFEV